MHHLQKKKKRDLSKKTGNKDEGDDITMNNETTPKENEPPLKRRKKADKKVNDTSPYNPLFGMPLTPNESTQSTQPAQATNEQNKPPFQSPLSPNVIANLVATKQIQLVHQSLHNKMPPTR